MKELEKLIDRIIERVNINLRELEFDVNPHMRGQVQLGKLAKFHAFYGITPHHPLSFRFSHSSLAGSYFLGKCNVDNAILYKSDIRGDELKGKGEYVKGLDYEIPLHDDEIIRIRDSFLIKTLIHNYSHDPENLEEFLIQNTAALHYANIHGSPTEGCFMGPFSTVDLTTIHDCVIGAFAYLQAGELSHHRVDPGTVWIRYGEEFDFLYRFSKDMLGRYIRHEAGGIPRGIFMDFVEDRKEDFQRIYNLVHRKFSISVPEGAALDRYAVVKGRTRIGENVLVAQRAYLEDASLGRGSNAQENCYIINSQLEGFNVTAHGAKVSNARLENKVFVGFNSFLRGKPDSPLTIGAGSIVMPHTVVDLEEPLLVPSGYLIWGYIRNREDLKEHSLSLKAFAEIKGGISLGAMRFKGSGALFVETFQNRIEHILEANGAYFDGNRNRGHAQRNQNISFNTIQPYPEGELEGIYPTIEIRP
jgi:carbonic anhydrase/acetyltransferase-like protein (isoleucine patch superfamily)